LELLQLFANLALGSKSSGCYQLPLTGVIALEPGLVVATALVRIKLPAIPLGLLATLVRLVWLIKTFHCFKVTLITLVARFTFTFTYALFVVILK